MNNVIIGKEYEWKLSTDRLIGKVIRELDDTERDPEVGRMYEITISVFEDELVEE